jgi:hypothetical protein
MTYQRVPPLGGGRAAERQPDPVERIAAQQAAMLLDLEAKARFTDSDRYAAQALAHRPFSDEIRRRAQQLQDKHGLPAGQRALIQSVQRPGQQGSGQGSGDKAMEAARRAGQELADAVRDAMDR